jgi:hypothetical protein
MPNTDSGPALSARRVSFGRHMVSSGGDTLVNWDRYPQVATVPRAREWLAMQVDLGRAPNTVDAYGRGLNDFLGTIAVPLEAIRRHHVAQWVGQLRTRRNPRELGPIHRTRLLHV